MDVPAEETAAGADTDIAAFADEPAEVVETEPIAEEADVPVLVVVIVPVTLVEAEAAPAVVPAEVPIPTELAEADPAVIPAAAPMPTAPTSDIFDPFQSSH